MILSSQLTDLTTSSTNSPLPCPTVVKRDGSFVFFDGERIRSAIEKAFAAEAETSPLASPWKGDGAIEPDAKLPQATVDRIAELANEVVQWCLDHPTVSVEEIQDQVERTLMLGGEHAIARRYVLYRDERSRARQTRDLYYIRLDGWRAPVDRDQLSAALEAACAGLGDGVDAEPVVAQTLAALYPGIGELDLAQAAIMAARALIEREPNYTYVAARLLLSTLYREATGRLVDFTDRDTVYADYFKTYFQRGVDDGQIDPRLLEFDLGKLASTIVPKRDLQFAFLGLQTIYDRYLLNVGGVRIELPQLFWMRVAMGLALNEERREERAIEFYNVLSQFRFTSATPTLFNAGTRHPQLSSCFLTTVSDNLGDIFKSIRDNALLSKWAGGLGNDWTNVRALGAHIKGTNGQSQGIVPFLKVANDAAIAVNQGGKRQGAVCAYLEVWHLDFEEFLDLRKNTGDDRRRTHDMHTSSWIPDLFMKRVQSGGQWTLFSPDSVPRLHDRYGRAFEELYVEYERRADAGEIALSKRLPAVDLWRRLLTALFETGHPWVTFKDPSNVRSSQDHVGVVHNSNLCTEILLNTSADETAVCNLGSVNLAAHVLDGALDIDRLAVTVRTAVRMLDNVIDINYYPTPEAENANRRNRPVGLGVMGFQDALYQLGVSYASDDAVEFADRGMEAISYFALLASSELAGERGAYPTYAGSKWDRGLLPIDTIDLLRKERGVDILMDRSTSMDWDVVRGSVKKHGMRNSNVLAIAPTATISNIIGVSQSIEPAYKNLYVKSNLSGEFTQVNSYLVDDLKRLGLWDEEMLDDLKYLDGSLEEIERIPDSVKAIYLTAFEVDPRWLIECASRRQKWIDMGQSLNLYMAQPSGKKLDDMYFLAWAKGLKTTYYLRTLAATQVEKSTIDINRRGIQPRWMKNKSASSQIAVDRTVAPSHIQGEGRGEVPRVCNLGEDCEACQ